MEIKQKYIDRLVNILDCEIDNIFSFDENDAIFSYDRERIIENGVETILSSIKEIKEMK